MPRRVGASSGATRVARHRRAKAVSGVRRVEVSIPAGDARLLRRVAATLRGGGAAAGKARATLEAALAAAESGTGDDILAFFRDSPLAEARLDLRRDPTRGRPIDL